MSGHSKWSQIKRQKGAADTKRGTLFTKLGRVITVAAREGGGDPAANFKLRLAIDRARSANLPKDNIERAIKRGTGEDKQAAQIETVTYEAYGPSGVALLIKCLTDNKNRAAAEIKHILSKYGGSLGTPGSVTWQFQEKGVIRLKTDTKKEKIELQAIKLGAEDVQEVPAGLTVYTAKADLQKINTVLAESVVVESAGLEQIPVNKVALPAAAAQQLRLLTDELDGHEYVDAYYHNANL